MTEVQKWRFPSKNLSSLSSTTKEDSTLTYNGNFFVSSSFLPDFDRHLLLLIIFGSYLSDPSTPARVSCFRSIDLLFSIMNIYWIAYIVGCNCSSYYFFNL